MAAIDELDDEAVLLGIVRDDEDAAVRSHALARIASEQTLDRLIADPAAPLSGELRDQARSQRLSQLLAADGSLPPAAGDETLLHITRLATAAELAEAAIERIQNSEILLDLAASHPLARARLCAAQRIEDTAALQGLMQQARHKDKAVFRLCRERVDEQLAARKAAVERQDQITTLAEEAAALREAADSPDYRARFMALQQRWEALGGGAASDLRERVQGDLDTCAKRVEQKADEEAAARQEQQRVEAAGQAFVDLLGELESIDAGVLAQAESVNALELQLNNIEERWVAAMRYAQPSHQQTESCKSLLSQWRGPLQTLRKLAARTAELERFHQAAKHVDAVDFKAIQKLSQQALKLSRALPWPASSSAPLPEALGSLQRQRESLEHRLAELQAQEADTVARVEQAFETFREELATNHFRNADRALNRLRNLLRQLTPARQDHFQHQLKPLLVRLQEIHDWQGFAIEPKKQELIEHMRALVGSGDDPDTLAAKIKALQKEWKALGPLAPRRDQELWKLFRAAADEAWAPCNEAFEQRAEARKQVYRQRMDVVAQLVEYERKIAWPDLEAPAEELPAPDWKMVRKTLNAARKAFADLVPVDRKQDRKSHKALDKVCNRIYAHLELEYGRNIQRKKDLVAEAQALIEHEDLRQAIERAKAIQREWKVVGLTPQRLDRPLWRDFRKACDAVFARLGDERNQRQAEARARAEHRKADAEARAAKAAERQRQKLERWQRLLDRMQACGLKAGDPEQAAALWGASDELPKGIDSESLAEWWERGAGDTAADVLREDCIALEVLAEIASPDEDKQARMAYQMQRLVEGLGAQREDGKERLRALINQFIGRRPGPEWVERFCGGITAARGLPGK
jgi:hypothetical protein